MSCCQAPTQPNPPLPQLSKVRRFGRYWLLRLIARGGMGEVYLAATTGIEGAERPCVIKLIRREHAKDSSFLARFLDEARVQAQLHHPGVVQIIEATTDENNEPFVVVEYVEGRSLGEVRARAIQVSYRLSWPEAVALAASAAEALAHVHERVDVSGNPLEIVHRDMSPQNIMVGYGGDVKLIDFGTARGENRRCHTVAGVVFAKPGYVAPEVANGNPGDARVDMYALGIILWELAAGTRFLQGNAAEHLAKVAKDKCSPPPIAEIIGAPKRLDTIIAKLTAFKTKERYSRARDALRDLAHLLSDAPSLSNGERGVRTRVCQLMANLYPAEPTQSRRLFAKLVEQARLAAKNGDVQTPTDLADIAHVPTEPDDRLLPGTRYRVSRNIGQGAMGSVLEAEHVDLGRQVAIKVLSAHHAMSSDYAQRFRREARTLSKLSHPNLVTLHDFGQTADGRLFCAMELLAGDTLDRKLEREGAMPWRDALKVASQAASALREAHNAGIIHRDIKPSNLFICNDGTVKLLDFGVAHSSKDRFDANPNGPGFSLFGTPEYMAPEQASAGKIDERADIYSLGTVMFEMITGYLPFNASSTVALLDIKSKNDPLPPSAQSPQRKIPPNVDKLILKAIDRNRDHRTASADKLLSSITDALKAPERKRRIRSKLQRLSLGAALAAASFSITIALAHTYPVHAQRASSAIVASANSFIGTARSWSIAVRSFVANTAIVQVRQSPETSAVSSPTESAATEPAADSVTTGPTTPKSEASLITAYVEDPSAANPQPDHQPDPASGLSDTPQFQNEAAAAQ